MSIKKNSFYYSFTSSPPPVSSLSESASAPSLNEVSNNNSATITAPAAPPGYEDAISKVDPSLPFNFQQPPVKNPELTGYVQDHSISAFIPSSSSSAAATNFDDQQRPLLSTTIDHNLVETTGNYDNEDHEPLLQSFNNQQDHQLIDMQPSPQQENPLAPPPNYSQYHAQYEFNKTGLLSRDRHLNHDGEALTQFLQQHNIPPHMKIRFYGYHDEVSYKSKNVRDKHGNWQEQQKPVTKRVEDFNFDLDCSESVSRQCHGVYVLPDPETAQIKTVRQLCDDYINEANKFKELHLSKVIHWNYAELTQAFTTAIRAHGYNHSVSISYELSNHIITIKSDSELSKMVDHQAVRLFFYITCLFIFTWPYLWITRKKFGFSTLKSEWKMKSSEREWYDQHIQQVLNQIPPTPRHTNVPYTV